MSDNTACVNGTLTECRFCLASVYVLNTPFYLDKTFDYLTENNSDLKAGDFVAVPFGGGNRPALALVHSVRVFNNDTELQKYKPIRHILNRSLSMDEEAIKLVDFLRERTFCTTGEAVKTIMPSSAFSKLYEHIICVSELPEYYSSETSEHKIYEFVKTNSPCEKQTLLAKFGQSAVKAINTLISCGALSSNITVREATNIKHITLYNTNLTESEIIDLCENRLIRSKKQREILEFLCEHGTTELSEITATLSVTSAQLKALIEKGYVISEERERYRLPYLQSQTPQNVTLNQEQLCAVEKINKLIVSDEANATLLYGVTGSGKTHVMKAVTENVVKSGKAGIILVPEISLTPQTINFFSASFGERTAIIHSGLSSGERFDAWRRIKRGEVDICIGTRSAIFAPFKNLGLIIIDEEQEHTYKSDQSPKYNVKDVAAFRCAYNKCTLLLASATPSIESYYKAMNGTYTLCELSSRYGAGGIPKADIVDMRLENHNGNFSLFSETLLEKIQHTIDNKKQVILFLNRRGYHNFVSCPSCGMVFTCPHCSVSLTYHKMRFNEKSYLLCHYCGYKTKIPERCSKCNNEKLRYMGYGTQLAEEQLNKIFPNAKTLRMDADTTSGKFSYDTLLSNFRNKTADILIGTQMVTKGHDFPDVELVGILSADQSLYVDDYRANERTFSLICQTVGRAGRRNSAGTAVIQSYAPEHNVLLLSEKQDYKAFYENELPLRRSLLFPPFCDLALLTVTSNRENDTVNSANILLKKIKELLSTSYTELRFQIFGPFEAPIYKLNEKFRIRIVIKFKNSKKSRSLFREALNFFYEEMPKNISVGIDINPTSL